jgi:hypothetical protein
VTGGRPDGSVVRPLERAQVVWRRAVTLSRSERDDDRFGIVLDLLRTAHHGPSTMLHALALGREQQRATPGDVPTRDAIRLLTRTIDWLGKRTDEHEVGAVRSARPPTVPTGRRP